MPASLFSVAALGAHIFQVAGPIEESITLLQRACTQYGLYEASTYRRCNPYQNEGIKTIGFEIYLDLGEVPDWIVVPAGGGGTLAAIWRAFSELRAMGLIERMHATHTTTTTDRTPPKGRLLGVGLENELRSPAATCTMATLSAPCASARSTISR
jgi:threonine synthase